MNVFGIAQNRLYLPYKISAGRSQRFPQAREAGVCVISGEMAEYLKVDVGDNVSLEILDSDPDERYKVSATGDQRSLEIEGIHRQFDSVFMYDRICILKG